MPSSANAAAIYQLSAQLGQRLAERSWRVATAESCTGGGISAAITAISGSSNWFEYGVVSYANQAKQRLLQVSVQTLDQEGAVSEAVVVQMLKGVLLLSGSDIGVAVSGIAGPSGGSPDKPVGSVWFAWGLASGELRTQLCHFAGDRQSVQQQSVAQGLRGLLEMLATC
jgi:nicotinamide-nucleotide amidase